MLLLWKHLLSVSFSTSGAIKIVTINEQLQAASSRWRKVLIGASEAGPGTSPQTELEELQMSHRWLRPGSLGNVRMPITCLLSSLEPAGSWSFSSLQSSVSDLNIYFQMKDSGWTCSNFWSWFKESWPTQIVVWSRSAASQECGQWKVSHRWAENMSLSSSQCKDANVSCPFVSTLKHIFKFKQIRTRALLSDFKHSKTEQEISLCISALLFYKHYCCSTQAKNNNSSRSANVSGFY